jgi:hypothetical protein
MIRCLRKESNVNVFTADLPAAGRGAETPRVVFKVAEVLMLSLFWLYN